MADPITRETRLSKVVGAPAKKLATERDIVTVGDLLDFHPRRYIDVETSGRITDFALDDHVAIVATVVSGTTSRNRASRGSRFEATLVDAEDNEFSLVFFRPYGHEQALQPGRRVLARGKLGEFRRRPQLAHPTYTVLDADAEGSDLDVYAGGLVPIYKATKGITDMGLTKTLKLVLEQLEVGADAVPDHLRERRGLIDEREAYRRLHLPRTLAEVESAKQRLRYEEALVVQTVLAQRRAKYLAEQAVPRTAPKGGLLEAFDAQLPFQLTAGQREVADEIAADMARDVPMHRLLQGEVGSGKTVVALRAMLAAVDSGAQAALLAPTEVLAQQHARSIRAMLGPLAEGGMLGGSAQGTQVALLTGSMTRRQKEKVLLDITTGPVGIVIGTHALIQDEVMFADLGLVVVDEQHRFGVEQRDALRDKAVRAPHLLVMTATPIPRSIAMTVFGDMETSTLRELPRGRQPIETFVVPSTNERWMQRTWQRVAEEVARGHQAYVICPRIGEETPEDDQVLAELERAWREGAVEDGADDAEPPHDEEPPPMRGVHEVLAQLREEPALAGLRIESMHGQLPTDEKDAVMAAFASGAVDVLVATTVVEVGVDVPNATAMVILDADRFGISQLHQLRGRVGRGDAGGVCLLATRNEEAALNRLQKVAETTDGFGLADLDLSLRREGDVLGAQQSGRRSQLRMLRLKQDADLIEQARGDAGELVGDDPELLRYPGLERAVTERLDEQQVAFLERG
ncbi:ATP-dependent DNA helicase RecG [Barrientosiimonas humi]|uniref:ATP-dependent DNA helicase RecG n=1 Tax=Barrientosiimonas humi TaxID=999931 RepID=UPI00370DA1BB